MKMLMQVQVLHFQANYEGALKVILVFKISYGKFDITSVSLKKIVLDVKFEFIPHFKI